MALSKNQKLGKPSQKDLFKNVKNTINTRACNHIYHWKSSGVIVVLVVVVVLFVVVIMSGSQGVKE